MRLLHVDSSILGRDSVSRLLTEEIVMRLQDTLAGIEVVYRDLEAMPINHLTRAHLDADKNVTQQAPSFEADLAMGKEALEEFLAAQIVVIGAPMYNFSIPSQLKAWIDRLAIAGKTFSYTESGPKGLAGGKKVIIASSRGGFYGPGTPASFLDHQESYLRGIFGFIGITDVTFIRAEGVKKGPEQRTSAIEAARRDIATLTA